ncbi:MAG: hypothetical protein IVW54_00535 [Candidatus Binataceae bacterium]|nr:hypothetical protein [Candidatus Binataceae bacterium]
MEHRSSSKKSGCPVFDRFSAVLPGRGEGRELAEQSGFYLHIATSTEPASPLPLN